ncbi:MAG: hypothetical protein K0V04_12460 [Deltaproteobacteria bacterium]|nr:hypothetical protein [Deltaproteobacteria bacterium]
MAVAASSRPCPPSPGCSRHRTTRSARGGVVACSFVAVAALGACDFVSDEDLGPETDAACFDRGVPAQPLVSIDRSAWPNVPQGEFDTFIVFDVPCLVTAVTTDAGRVTTVFECDDAGVARPLEVTIPAAADPVAWAAGDTVDIEHHHNEFGEDFGSWRDNLAIRRASDGAVLLASSNQERLEAETFAPLVVDFDAQRCAPADAFEGTWNLVLRFENSAGAVENIAHMQQGHLAPGAGEGVFAIDVGETREGDAYCCHANRHIETLVRRTLPQ